MPTTDRALESFVTLGQSEGACEAGAFWMERAEARLD